MNNMLKKIFLAVLLLGSLHVYAQNNESLTFSIDEHSPEGTLVGSVKTEDPDGNVLTYTIISGNDAGVFAVDYNTGDITIKSPGGLDFEISPSFTLDVLAYDGQDGFFKKSITINLNDVEDTTPVADPIVTQPEVEDNTPTSSDRVTRSNPARGLLRVGRPTGKNAPVDLKLTILDNDTQAPIESVNVVAEPSGVGSATNAQGEATITTFTGRITLSFGHLSYRKKSMIILLIGEGEMTVYLKPGVEELDEVVIAGNQEANIRSTTIGKNELSIETIKDLPLFAGQVDVIKSLTLLPGVSSVGEISSGLNVRGGQADNNLVLLGGAPIYNPSHLFGFFSAINADVVRSVSLYKGGIPAKYGGRSSSVLDIVVKNGDFNEWNGSATIGMVSSNVAVDGPISDKFTVVAAGRASYVNWLLERASDEDIRRSNAGFYDVNTALTYIPNNDHKFDYKFYNSYDDFNFISDTTISWQNQNHSLSWDYALTDFEFINVSASNSNYDYSISNSPGVLGFNQFSEINDTRLMGDYLKEFESGTSVNLGFNASYVRINPGEVEPKGGSSSINPVTVENEKGLELAGFAEYKRSLTNKLAVELGVRYNHYKYLGPRTVNRYEENGPLTESNVTSTDTFGDNEVIATYDALNPRVGLRYAFNQDLSLKGGVSRQSQFIHLISNTTTFTPTDTWKLSDSYVQPNEAWIYSLGIFKNLGLKYEVSLEGYYKPILNVIEYKDGADLQLKEDIETELLNADGRSYGLEFYMKKSGRLSGWVSYTYSRSERRVESGFSEFEINDGEWFPANFDTPHNLSLTMNYVISQFVEFSSTFIFSNGRPTSLPSAKLEYAGNTIAYFNERNGFRIPNYHRLDISWIWSIKSQKKLLAGDVIFSVYNLYGRQNAYSVFFDDVIGAPPQGFKLSILGSAFPAISYKINFL